MAVTRIRVNRDEPQVIDGVLKDDNGDVVPGSAVTAAKVTLYDVDTWSGEDVSPRLGIINGHDQDDLYNTEFLTIGEDGSFVWYMQAEDNPIVTSRRQVERHRAVLHFEFSFGSPAADGLTREQFELEVVNLGV